MSFVHPFTSSAILATRWRDYKNWSLLAVRIKQKGSSCSCRVFFRLRSVMTAFGGILLAKASNYTGICSYPGQFSFAFALFPTTRSTAKVQSSIGTHLELESKFRTCLVLWRAWLWVESEVAGSRSWTELYRWILDMPGWIGSPGCPLTRNGAEGNPPQRG